MLSRVHKAHFFLLVLLIHTLAPLTTRESQAQDTQDFQIDGYTSLTSDDPSKHPHDGEENSSYTDYAEGEESDFTNTQEPQSELADGEPPIKPRTRTPDTLPQETVTSFGLRPIAVPSKIVGAVAVIA